MRNLYNFIVFHCDVLVLFAWYKKNSHYFSKETITQYRGLHLEYYQQNIW